MKVSSGTKPPSSSSAKKPERMGVIVDFKELIVQTFGLLGLSTGTCRVMLKLVVVLRLRIILARFGLHYFLVRVVSGHDPEADSWRPIESVSHASHLEISSHDSNLPV